MDDCVIYWAEAAQKELRALGRRDPRRAGIVRRLAKRIEENGWILSTKAALLKVLRREQCVGELRDVVGGYRLFMFWYDTVYGREIWVCRIIPKRDVVSHRRLSEICDAVAQVRKRFIEEGV
jgi:signal recognition particle subunit SEC65